jgi:hypothetical protein
MLSFSFVGRQNDSVIIFCLFILYSKLKSDERSIIQYCFVSLHIRQQYFLYAPAEADTSDSISLAFSSSSYDLLVQQSLHGQGQRQQVYDDKTSIKKRDLYH